MTQHWQSRRVTLNFPQQVAAILLLEIKNEDLDLVSWD